MKRPCVSYQVFVPSLPRSTRSDQEFCCRQAILFNNPSFTAYTELFVTLCVIVKKWHWRALCQKLNMKKPMLQIWDLTRLEDMRDAWQMLETAKSDKSRHYKDYKVALRAAIECYSSSKASPLHTTIQNNHLQSMQVCCLSSKLSWAHYLTLNSVYLYLWQKQDCQQTEFCSAENACRCASYLMHQVLPASRNYEIICCTVSLSASWDLKLSENSDTFLWGIPLNNCKLIDDPSLWVAPNRALTISTWIMFTSLLKPYTPSSLASAIPARTFLVPRLHLLHSQTICG